MTATAPAVIDRGLTRVYVWDLPVRITHWLIATALGVLAVTGYYIGNPFIVAPDPAGQEFVMATVQAIHFFAAIVFTLSELSRIAWMFMGNRYARWHQLIPTNVHRWKLAWEWFKFYLFFRPVPPRFVGHNPLAGLTYVLVYALCLVMALSGYALFSIQAGAGSPMKVFGVLLPLFGGPQTARWLHHTIMWLLVAFVVHHVSAAIVVARSAKNATIDSMFTGYRFASAEDLAAEEGGRAG